MKEYIIRRITKRNGNKYYHKYYNDKGIEIKDDVYIKRIISGIYIAPAYNNVKINLNKNDKVLAIGYDTKKRAQYVYNKEYTKGQSNKKFNRMIDFGKHFKKINRKINEDFYSVRDSKDKQVAIILRLIMECQFRVGNDIYSKKNKSYGTTTLKGKHIRIKNKNQIVIDFNGKKDVRNTCTIKNKPLVKTLKKKKRYIRREDRLFSYRKNNKYYNIRAGDVNRYLKQFGDYTAKDFRTWGANIELIKQFTNRRTNDIKKCIENVSQKLHNTPAICKSNYLDPELIDFYKDDREGFLRHFNFKKDDVLYNQYVHFLEDL